MGKDQNEQVTELEKIAVSMERIATALEKIAVRPRRKSIGAVFGSIIDHAHKHVIGRMQHPDEYAYLLLNYLTSKYPLAKYPADITRFITPEVMITLVKDILSTASQITGDPEHSAQILVYSLQDAGFWED